MSPTNWQPIGWTISLHSQLPRPDFLPDSQTLFGLVSSLGECKLVLSLLIALIKTMYDDDEGVSLFLNNISFNCQEGVKEGG